MSKARILFVDDEQRILDGLRRSLRGKRGEWDMSFVTSGDLALEVLAGNPHDVVVSDMRMPGMDGADLLTHVSKLHPEVARVVLSGHTEPESAIKVAVAGHRFLNKPTDTDSVTSVIEQLTATSTSHGHAPEVRRIAGAVRSLPTLPDHVDRLAEILCAPDVDLHRAIRAASSDIGLTAKLLQLSNSEFFGARARVASVESVVNNLGLQTIQALVGAGQVLWSSVEWGSDVERDLGVSWRHGVATAYLVGSMASPAHRPYAQAAALLQDVGRFAALASARCTSGAAVDSAVRSGLVPYRDVGVDLLHLWGLPRPIITAVAERDAHHQPSPAGLGVTGAVRVAHLLLQSTESRELTAGADEEELALLLAHPQLAARAADWRHLAEEASARSGGWTQQ